MNRSLATVVLGVAFGAVVATLSASASACRCPERTLSSILPSAHSRDVPTNTHVWVTRERGCTHPTVVDERGTRVPAKRRTFEPDVVVVDPIADLILGETYSILCGRRVLGTFTVSSPADTVAPKTPIVRVGVHEQHESQCGPFGTVGLEVGGVATDRLLILDIAGEGTFDEKELSGTAVDVFSPTDLPHVGTSWACQDDNWSFERRGDASEVRLMAVDLAGNTSAWSSPKKASTACSVAGGVGLGDGRGRGVALLGLLGAALALTRRRARS